MTQRQAIWLLIMGVLVSLGPGVAGDFVWDDRALTVGYPLAHDGIWGVISGNFLVDGGGAGAYWRPVTSALLWMQTALFGEVAPGYHLVSLLVHLANTLMVFFWLARRVPGPAWPAFLAAGIFAWHPTRPESVSWIAGSTDLWMAFFSLAALTLWDRRKNGVHALGVGLLLTLAVWSKEVAVVVPMLMKLDSIAQGESERSGLVRDLGIVFGLVFCAFAIRLGMAPADGGELDALTHLSLICSSMGQYLSCMFWPWQPSVEVGIRTLNPQGVEVFPAWSLALGAVGWAVLAGGLALAWLRKPWRPWGADLAWVLLPLLPVLQLIPLGTHWVAANRYLYLPLLGVSCLVVRLLHTSSIVAQWGVPVGGMLLIGLGAATAVHTGHFESDEALWSYEVSLHPDSLIANENLGEALNRNGEREAALKSWEKGRAAAEAGNSPEREAIFQLLQVRDAVTSTPSWEATTLDELARGYGMLQEDGKAAFPVEEGFVIELKSPWGNALVKHADRFVLPAVIALNRAGYFEESEKRLQFLLADIPASQMGWRELVRSLALRWKWEEASRALEQARKVLEDPAWGGNLQRRVDVARQMSRMPLPEDIAEHAGQRLVRSRVAALMGAMAVARKHLDGLEEAHGSAVSFWVTLGQLELEERQFERAIAVMERASVAKPDQEALWKGQIKQLQAAAASDAASKR